jgi:hypothetical protein
MESINSFTLGVKFCRLPFRHIITNLIDKVLKFAAVYVGVQDCFDKVWDFTINLDWSWWIRPLARV